MKRKVTIAFSFVMLCVFSACGGSSSSSSTGTDQAGDASALTIVGSTSSGDFTPSVNPSVDSDGSLKFTVSAVDVDGDGTVGTPSVSSITVTSGSSDIVAGFARNSLADTEITCSSRDVGAGSSDDSYDIGFCLDTTASMGGAAGVMADKIATFATALSEAGVDASYAGLTLGDAFATKSASSSFTDAVSEGDVDLDGTDDEPPSFDSSERPGTGDTLINATDLETFFSEVSDVVSSGEGGGDLPENYLGCLEWLVNNVGWRSAASKVLVVVGDDCSHTEETADAASITANWMPPSINDVNDIFAGVATVHVVGVDGGSGDCGEGVTSDYYNMPDLATATGGTFTEISGCDSADTCNVDLEELPISSSITSGVISDCDASCTTFEAAGTYTFTINVSMVDGSSTYTATSTIVISITFGTAC